MHAILPPAHHKEGYPCSEIRHPKDMLRASPAYGKPEAEGSRTGVHAIPEQPSQSRLDVFRAFPSRTGRGELSRLQTRRLCRAGTLS